MTERSMSKVFILKMPIIVHMFVNDLCTRLTHQMFLLSIATITIDLPWATLPGNGVW